MAEVSILNGYKIKDKKAIRFYNNVDDMVADNSLKEGMHVKTSGFYALNDGGSAEYKIINDNNLVSDNSSIISLQNGLFAKLIISKVIDIKQFGAKGNAEDDDTEIFQRAIDYCTSSNGSIKIKVPHGRYVIGNLNLKRYTNIEGDGWGSTILIVKEDLSDNCLSITDPNAFFIKLKDFSLVGNMTNNTCPNGIYIHRPTIDEGDIYEKPNGTRDSWIDIENVRITGIYGNGIGTETSQNNCRENRITNVDINNCRGYGTYISGSDNNYLNITCWGNGLGGFYHWGSAEKFINCKSFGNGATPNVEFYNAEAFGFKIRGVGYQIISCEAQENNGHGFVIDGTPESNYIIRADANGRSEKGTGTYTHAGIYFTDATNQRINMQATCYDFIKASGSSQSQGYGIIFNNSIVACNIICNIIQNNEEYSNYSRNISANGNNIIINGRQITDKLINTIWLQPKNDEDEQVLGYKSKIKIGKKAGVNYEISHKSTGDIQLDLYDSYIWKSALGVISSNGDIKMGKSDGKLGFYMKTPVDQQITGASATDLQSAITLINNIKNGLIANGLFKES